jgi:hypothetical protein
MQVRISEDETSKKFVFIIAVSKEAASELSCRK